MKRTPSPTQASSISSKPASPLAMRSASSDEPGNAFHPSLPSRARAAPMVKNRVTGLLVATAAAAMVSA